MKIDILFSGGFSENIGVNTIRELNPNKISALWNFKHHLIGQIFFQMIAENFNPLTVDGFEFLDMGL